MRAAALVKSPGRPVALPQQYAPQLLEPIPRATGRDALGIAAGPLPFFGEDVWQAWELAWLDSAARPQVAAGRFTLPCTTPHLIESKSLKLYLYSLHQTVFESPAALRQTLQADMAAVAGGPVAVEIIDLAAPALQPQQPPGVCIDAQAPPLTPGTRPADADLLRSTGPDGRQVLYSHLLRCLCPVTAQPDWATVVVSLQGGSLAADSLLAYLGSFRRQREFHEQCAERIYLDIMRVCQPAALSVQALYTRRGGLDITPWRSSRPQPAPRLRSMRQ